MSTPPPVQTEDAPEEGEKLPEAAEVDDGSTPPAKSDNENPADDDDGAHFITEDDTEFCATCRPCCTFPHGRFSIYTAVAATVAWVLALVVLSGCDFMRADFEFCIPPVPLFGKCGNCSCIPPANGTCPPVEDLPREIYSVEEVKQWKALTHVNPMNITCNPYKNETCDTTPPQTFVEEWEDAVCAVKYDTANIDENQCPIQYSTFAYQSEADAVADGAFVTHYGTCGVCSSLQDLAVYIEYPDLTAEGQECGITGLINEEDGIRCFQDVGYSRACAVMWMYNVFNTRDKCFDSCIAFTFGGDANNAPPPKCTIAPCLECDEVESGPIFKRYAARARRRSGLLSKIARPCDAILNVNHSLPCPGIINTTTPLFEEPTETCFDQEVAVGPLNYADVKSDVLFSIGFLESEEEKRAKSFYSTCTGYNIRNAVGGYMEQVQDILGAAWQMAASSAIITVVLGTVCVMLTWSTTCAAYKQNLWAAMAILYFVCGIFQLLVLVFLASDICPSGGCEKLNEFTLTIVSGIFWFIASVFAWFARGRAKPGQHIQCCCCPTFSAYPDGGSKEMDPLIAGGQKQITITETIQSDGSKVTRKVITNPDGMEMIETMTTQSGQKSLGISS